MFAFHKFNRCFYQITKQTVNPHQAGLFRWYYCLDWAVFIYSFRILIASYIQYHDFQKSLYDFEKYDPFLNYFYLNSYKYDSFTTVILFLFSIFWFICEYSLYHLNINTPTWKFWNQLVVQNQDRYYECVLQGDKLTKIEQQKEHLIMKRIMEQKYIKQIIPEIGLQIYCKLWAKVEIWFQLKNVDKKKLFSQPLSILPNVSPKLRSYVLLIMFLADKLCLIVQIVVGSYRICTTDASLTFVPFRKSMLPPSWHYNKR